MSGWDESVCVSSARTHHRSIRLDRMGGGVGNVMVMLLMKGRWITLRQRRRLTLVLMVMGNRVGLGA